MKRAFLFFVCQVIVLNGICQGINNLWMMGYGSSSGRPYGGTNINFSSTSADTSWHFRQMNFSATNAIISDSSGNLLFYSNGVYIANALDDTMLNGSGLNPSSYTTSFGPYGLKIPQGDIIIPFPGDSLKYYLFHETLEYTTTAYHAFELLYSIIDMSLDSGRGAVTQKNIPIIQDTLLVCGVTACKHANGRDWWIIVHKYRSNIWYTLLVTKFGIQGPYSQFVGPLFGVQDLEEGQVAFSPDGSRYVRHERNMGLDLYNFDRCSGTLSNSTHTRFNEMTSAVGVSFSPDSKILYANNNQYLFQFDLTSANPLALADTIGIFDNYYDTYPLLTTSFLLEELAPDGKIYLNTGNGTHWLHVINSPNSLGSLCDFQQHSFQLPSYNAFTIPCYPNYFLGAEGGSICDSLPTALQSVTVNKPGGLKVFPNPVIGTELSFTYNVLTQPAIVSIINIYGKEVAKYYLPQWSSIQHVKLPKLVSGVYLARLEMNGQFSDVKFIVE